MTKNWLKTTNTKGKKKAKTPEEEEWMKRVAQLDCIICNNNLVLLHHITTLRLGYSRKSSHFAVLPLCHNCHDAKIKGRSLHEGVGDWEKKNGTQIEWLRKVYEWLGESSERCEKVIKLEIY
jgi:hypothetical protein